VAPLFFDPHVCSPPPTEGLKGLEMDFECRCWEGRIAFNSDRDGKPGIYVMDADGTALERLTDDPYVMGADGTGVTRLTDAPAEDTGPDWSPTD
jgi:hypothetical protein